MRLFGGELTRRALVGAGVTVACGALVSIRGLTGGTAEPQLYWVGFGLVVLSSAARPGVAGHWSAHRASRALVTIGLLHVIALAAAIAAPRAVIGAVGYYATVVAEVAILAGLRWRAEYQERVIERSTVTMTVEECEREAERWRRLASS